MVSLFLLRGPGEPVGTRRELGTFARLWKRIRERAERAEAQARQEREEAKALLAELMGLPSPEQRLETVEREPRFWTLGLVEHLLQAAGAAEAASALGLAELALALVRRFDPQRYAESLILEQEVIAWSLWAEAQRRQGDFARAESGFRTAAGRVAMEPLEVPERGTLCRYLARLRQDQGREDEALGLLQRAADLFKEAQEPAAAGEVLSEQGWFCLTAGDPATAHASFEHAVTLLFEAQRPQALTRAWYGLALASAELGFPEEARHALQSGQALDPTTPGSAEASRHLILAARIADLLGEPATAAGLLESALADLLAAPAFYDSAIAALELIELYAAQGRAADLQRLRERIAPLFAPGALPDRALSVLLLAFHQASIPGQDATELLAQAGEFLERARERPWLRFQLAREPHMEVLWDRLDPEHLRGICERAGLAPEIAAMPAAELPTAQRDLLTWTYELLAGVRIAFDPPAVQEEWRGPWMILNRGRAWTAGEIEARRAIRPERLEVVHGKLLRSDEERKALLAMLLENVGADEAVRLAPRETWLAALAAAPASGAGA